MPKALSGTQEVLGVQVMDGSVCGRSTQSMWSPDAMLSSPTETPVYITRNASLPWSFNTTVDEDGSLEVSLHDPFGTPVLEWRFERGACP